jgi:peptidyl-prolyl cis-trans isomerase B (cyclophilin B)
MIASRSLKQKNKNCKTSSCDIEKCDCTTAIIKTSKGDIKIQLDAEKSPNTVKNFLSYVKEGQYNDTIFHRVISNFMIQGGELLANGEQKKPSRGSIKSEANNGLKNERGAIAMARTDDPNSAKAQFFINVRNNSFLNYGGSRPGYTVFGKVKEGMDVVDEIKNGKTKKNDWPEDPTTIEEITLH